MDLFGTLANINEEYQKNECLREAPEIILSPSPQFLNRSLALVNLLFLRFLAL